MKQFYPQPYKLYNKIQHYNWGTKNENAFIPNLLGLKPEYNLPYAELWIGTHPKAPSEIEVAGERISLDKVVEKYPLECLGKSVCDRFNKKFPFLLKVLSAAHALSIQTHPNKEQAEKLHRVDPRNYPDDNHKPEIAIAIDSLTAIAGFKPVNQIRTNIEKLIELNDFVGDELVAKTLKAEDEIDAAEFIRVLYASIMEKCKDEVKLAKCIESIYERLSGKPNLSKEEEQFLEQKKIYGADVGLLSFFFFNIIELKKAQAIFMDAGIPHAYISGNIIECMANSDNVVRAGLTNKFKDVDTLLEIIKYDFEELKIINKDQQFDEFVYETTAKEFELTWFEKTKAFSEIVKTKDKLSVYLITSGTLQIDSKYFSSGDAVLIPASLKKLSISSDSFVQFFVAGIPD